MDEMTTSLALGLDVGSTTVKAVVVDSHGQIVFSDYRRHHADVRGELAKPEVEHVLRVQRGNISQIGLQRLMVKRRKLLK